VADVCLWDWASGPVAARRDAMALQRLGGAPSATHVPDAAALHERVFAWLTLGDERNLVQTWVAGRCRYIRTA
jgi:guanine deaminase